jgi:hypothetical protein
MKDKELPLILGGDGRADTPGHSAKYGSYAMLNIEIFQTYVHANCINATPCKATESSG